MRLTYAALELRERRLFQRLWDGIGQISGVTRYGPEPSTRRTATLACAVAGIPAIEVARRLIADACFVSHGDYYATTVARRLGVEADGMVRIGAACYTTESEIDRVVEGICRIAQG